MTITASLSENNLTPSPAPFAGGGQMGELVRHYDWNQHRLGNPEGWPKSLQTGVRMMLQSGYPMFIWWSQELYMFHNDAYAPTFVGRHGEVLGAKAREVWADVWGQLGGVVEDILANGNSFYAEDMRVVPERKGFREETYWTFSYSPMPDDSGKVNGIFCACSDVTDKVLSERRMSTLHQLTEGSLSRQTVEQVCAHTLAVLGKNAADLPLAALYQVDPTGQAALLQGQTDPALELPARLELPAQAAPLGTAGTDSIRAQLPLLDPDAAPSAGPPDPSLRRGVVLPLAGQHGLLGFLVTGVSPMLEYNPAYRRFHALLAGQLAGDLEGVALRERQQRQAEAQQAQLEAQRNRLYSLFEQAPVAITILEGESYVVGLANPAVLEIWARTREQVLGKPLFEAMPEIRYQGLEGLLAGVRTSGAPYVGRELPVELYRHGKREKVYFNFVYHPVRNAAGVIADIAVVATDVTGLVLSRQRVEESASQLQALNEELTTANEELRASYEELQASNEELLTVRRALEALNDQLEARVASRTEQLRRAQAEAQAQRARLERFFSQAPPAICALDGPELVFELVNPAFAELYPGRELLGRTLTEALPEIAQGPYYNILQRVYQTGETFEGKEVPFPVARRQGGPPEEVYFDFIYQARLDEQGKVDGILAFGYEVTAKVLARKQVEESEQKFKMLSEAIPQLIWTATPDGQVNYYNAQWYAYTGLDFDRSKGEGWARVFHPEDLPALLAIWRKALQAGEPYRTEARLKSAEGAYRWFLIQALPFKDERGRVVQWFGTDTDIHDRRMAEEALFQMSQELSVANEEIRASNQDLATTNQRLLQTNADLDNFIYTASHDLKAPILNIEGLMKVLTRRIEPLAGGDQMLAKTFQMMAHSVTRFKETIADLTDVARIQKQTDEPAEPVSLTQTVRDTLLDLSLQIEESGARIELDLEAYPVLLFSRKNLKSVLYNLLSNAIKYRHPDRQPRIRVSCQTAGNFLLLSVQDNGLGMDTSDESKIFGMFKRLHAHVEGTGIGLYIVKKIVENAGGRIEVESTVGEGTTFTVYFKR
jgi:PAS domain S-box-containing protein